MSTKPLTSELPLWATAPVTGGVIVPSAAKQARGWVPGERPPAQYMNWLLVKTYLWLKWLSDGDVSFNTLAVASTSAFTGLVTMSGGAAIVGGISQTGGGSTSLSGALNVTGAGSFSSTVAVTGLATLNGGITVTAGNTNIAGTVFNVTAPATFTVALSTAAINASGPITLGANQSVKISGTGNYIHDAKTLTKLMLGSGGDDIVPISGTTPTGPAAGGHFGVSLAASSVVLVPLPFLPAHNRLVGVVLYFSTYASDAQNVTSVSVYKSTDLAVSPTPGSSFPDGWSAVSTSSFTNVPGNCAWYYTGPTTFQPTNGTATYGAFVTMSSSGAAKLMAVSVLYDTPT